MSGTAAALSLHGQLYLQAGKPEVTWESVSLMDVITFAVLG